VLRGDGIIREELPGGGVRLSFPAKRMWGAAATLTMFLALWTGVVWMVYHFDAGLLFEIVFGGFGVLIFLGTLNLWLSSAVVEANLDGIRSRGGWLGLGQERYFSAEEIEQLSPNKYMSSGTNVWTRIELRTRSGTKRKVTGGLRGKLVERTVLDELHRALGREVANAG
jgi:hypothetical protein